MQIHTSHTFFKGNKKHWIKVGQWTKAGHHGNKLRGTGAGCVRVCVWDGRGGEMVSEVLILGKMGGLLQEQLLHLISLY